MKAPRDFKPRFKGRWFKPQNIAARIRATNHWLEFSKKFRSQHPLCFDPYRIHSPSWAPCMDVHHIIPLSVDPDLAYDEENCAALCRQCHGRIEGQQRAGKSTGHLFEKGPAHA